MSASARPDHGRLVVAAKRGRSGAAAARDTHARRAMAALAEADGRPLDKAALLQRIYAGQSVPSTGSAVIKQLMCVLRGRGARIEFRASRGWVLITAPPVSECAGSRQEVLDALLAAAGRRVPAPALAALLFEDGARSARSMATVLLNTIRDLRSLGHDILGNTRLGYWIPRPRVPDDGAQPEQPVQSVSAHRIPSHRDCLMCRQSFPTEGQPLYRCKLCLSKQADEVMVHAVVGARAWR